MPKKRLPPKRSFEFLPLSVRVETLGGVATPLVLRGTPLPAKRWEMFSTAADNQVSVMVELCMGESPLARNNLNLGKFAFKGMPGAKRGIPEIKIEYSVDKTCSVTARASLKGSDLFAEETFHPPHELSDEFINSTLVEAEERRETDEAELLRVEATNRARKLVAQAEERLAQGSNSTLSEAVAALGLALAAGESIAIREKSDVLESILGPATGMTGFDFSNIFATFTQPARTRASVTIPTKKAHVEQGLTAQSQPLTLGKIFGGTSFTLDSQLCFVLMPFAPKLQPLYDDHIRPTIERSGLGCERADDIRGTNLITWDIWERINRARFLIADLTDQNSNVFYELGLAHALSKDVILITQSMKFVPFDLKSIRCIPYDFTPRGTQTLEKGLSETIAALMKSS